MESGNQHCTMPWSASASGFAGVDDKPPAVPTINKLTINIQMPLILPERLSPLMSVFHPLQSLTGFI
jgi:hypothetical protein